MSTRQAHLPPRCPFQKKAVSRPVRDPSSTSPPTNSNNPGYFPRHHRSPSQGSILEDQPAWLEDLLSDPEVSTKGAVHRRSASDSVALLDGLGDSLQSLNLGSNAKLSDVKNEERGMLELDCTYGPNSPRGRSSGMTFSDSGIVSALSEYISQNPLQLLDGSLCISGTTNSDSKGDGPGGTNGDFNPEMKPGKRQSGQRSRVRKLQYIAELEKTVNIFQAFESELAVRVATLLQQRVTLTMENAKLKQKMARLRQEKLIMEGQYQSLRKEAERLKADLASSPNRHRRAYSETSLAARAGISEANWQTLG
ncbi:basic leucine zipper 6 [Punica granatum]|uniref:Uncharacterized protein n=2 Tax=Punica granatum TaxID=22663 RepID=A0A2I0II78_PUNGR|nr:basic leucine zipper 6 [Punica granatum]PKI43016.1 hypothetical protein CRG98_036594 [Punica granatum]